jgi:effector-binding domain-containing protein
MSSACKIVTVERRLTAVIKAEAPFAQLPKIQRSARSKLQAVLPSLDCGPLGPTCTRWMPPADGKLPMEIGVIVARAFATKEDVVSSDLPAGRAVHLLMKGPFDGLPGAWQALFGWCKAEALATAGINWEIYGPEQDAELYALLA